MQFEDFDKRIKDAADHHHPAYDEQAWAKMEKLLNKHLPQEDDNRRRFLFLILLFLGLGAAGLLITRPWKKNAASMVTAYEKVNQVQDGTGPAGKKDNSPDWVRADTVSLRKGTEIEAGHSSTPAPPITVKGRPVERIEEPGTTSTMHSNNQSSAPLQVAGQNTTRKRKAVSAFVHPDGKPETKIKSPTSAGTKDPAAQEKAKNNATVSPVPLLNGIASALEEDPHPKEVKTGEVASSTAMTAPVNQDLVTADIKTELNTKVKEPETSSKKEDKKQASRKKSSFFLSFSAGPDLSFVRNNKAGDAKFLTGLGLGYNYKDRLTLRTGFYSARKVYTASPEAYDPPPGFYALYPYLEKVDADCKVYEIPVALSYNFGKKRNWFVSGGLSTFLMNEETYNYHYKYTPMGNTYTNKWTIRNENSHFFSVATISGGYKKDIGKRITVMAEPYFKLPLGGVGYGKVKLNSGGVLFTIGVKPF